MLRPDSAVVARLAGASRRTLNLCGAGICLALILFAWYLQYGRGLEPCPLCLLQRWVFWALGAAFLLAAIWPAGGPLRFIHVSLLTLLSATGAGIAGRHLWLQGLPPEQVPACGPDLLFMLDTFPLFEALSMTLQGSGDCAVIDWSFLGLSIPGWALLWFIVLGVAGVAINLRARR